MADNDFSAGALRIMRARSGGLCEGCGIAARLEAHHVLYRSRGGDGGAGNGLLLHGSGNHSGCHGKAHTAEGAALGWSVVASVGERPPVRHYRFGLVHLTDDGLALAADGFACWAHSSSGPVAGCLRCRVPGRVVWKFEDEKGWAI